jgi:hypothetical protein
MAHLGRWRRLKAIWKIEESFWFDSSE